MAIDLNQSNVALTSHFNPMLESLQANILKFHGRTFAYHLFFQIKPAANVAALKEWITDFATVGVPLHDGSTELSRITSAKKQLKDTALFKKDKKVDGGTIFTLSLSSTGYDKLDLTSFKPKDADAERPGSGFEFGLKESKDFLGDDPDNWEEWAKQEIDLLIIVADSTPKTALAKADGIIAALAPFTHLLHKQRGNVLKTDIHVGIEHFGYADGVSQPMYLADEINAQTLPKTWNDETPLQMVLVKEGDNPNADNFGSFLVFRKLEQHVKQFKDASGDNIGVPGASKPLLPNVLKSNGNPNTDLSGAMLVGRFENGTPVTMMDEALNPDPHTLTNDFDYTSDPGLKCPYFAHIRLVNPRNGDPLADPAEVRTHRITRRAIPWDDNSSPRFDDDKVLKITEHMLRRGKMPDGNVGLLFMCYQSDIKSHFEELQGQWANTGIIDPNVTSKGKDNLIAQPVGGVAVNTIPLALPVQWGHSAQSVPFTFPNFIDMKGGEYFYTPSLYFLQHYHHA